MARQVFALLGYGTARDVVGILRGIVTFAGIDPRGRAASLVASQDASTKVDADLREKRLSSSCAVCDA